MTRGDVITRVRAARWLCAIALLTGAMVASAPGAAWAQFSSGSNGMHGVFPPEPQGGIPGNWGALVWNMRTGKVAYCTVYTVGTGLDVCDGGPLAETQIQGTQDVGGPANGVYQFTNFDVTAVYPYSRNIYVVGTSPNVPLTILSQNEIRFAGSPNGQTVALWVRGADGRTPLDNSASLSVAGGLGGPGGFNGGASGNGGTTPSNGSPGFGPAGGSGGIVSTTSTELIATSAQGSALNPSLSPLTGGSGGGGGAGVSASAIAGCNVNNYAGGSGGGGGGALLLSATNKVHIGSYAVIYAHGGNGGSTGNGCGYGGGGAGGNVRIVASLIEGGGSIHVNGANRGNSTAPAPGGSVRFEAASNTFSGPIQGAVGGSFVNFPTAPLPANQPQLRIASIDGTPSPAAPGASLASPDISFATPVVAPVTLTVNASNVPLGTTVTIRVTPAIGNATTATTLPLAGTLADSFATAQVTLPPGAGVVTATASFNIGQQALNGIRFDGELAQRMEIVTQPDGTSKTYLVARSGARFEIGVRQ